MNSQLRIMSITERLSRQLNASASFTDKNEISKKIRTNVGKLNACDTFLSENKISVLNLKSVIKKFNKLYLLCKSKKVDKLKKFLTLSHKLRTVIKKRLVKRIKRKYKLKNKRRKNKQKKNTTVPERYSKLSKNTETVRNNILEQLKLLRTPKPVTDDSLTNTKIQQTLNVDENVTKQQSEFSILRNSFLANRPNSPKPSTSFARDNVTENLNSGENNIKARSDPSNSNEIVESVKTDSPEILHLEKSRSKFFIRPTKTNDITKIKGWRKKQFLNLDNSNVSNERSNLDFGESTSKSAFESEALNKFLTNNSKLNISYEVPKLIAEEAISDVTSTIDKYNKQIKLDSNPIKHVPKSEKRCKAKTLAEKRKMIECDRQKELLHEMEVNEQMLIKQLRHDEKRHRSETVKEIREALKNQTMPISREFWATVMKTENNQSLSQNIKFGNQNIRITGSYGGTDIMINDQRPAKTRKGIVPNGNVVILNEVNSTEIKQNYDTILNFNRGFAKYKPGPLSKKYLLDVFKDKKWETVVMPLPKIILEVRPEYKKPINPSVLPYLQMETSDKGFISEIWANFAASALRSVETKKQINFPLNYANNQQKVIMKKLIKSDKMEIIDYISSDTNQSEFILPDLTENFETNSDNVVKQVINDMLKYLETPILDNSNIKYCPDCPKFEESENTTIAPIQPILTDIHAVLSSSRKRKSTNLKTERELKRLNVQVIEVDLASKNKSKSKNVICEKPECCLGCVCNDSDVEWPQHCGRELCIFKCQCKIQKTSDKQKNQCITLPQGSNLLSAETVDQIRDQAKRNLAKEERKFTQTVIKANDQTIVVGEGCRERRLRAKKVPQKYTEFVNNPRNNPPNVIRENSNQEQDSNDSHKRQNIPIWRKNTSRKNSVIEEKIKLVNNMLPKIFQQVIVPKVENLIPLKSVLPWCMVHNLYKCFCKGHALENNLALKPKKVTVDKNQTSKEDYIEYSSKRSYNTNHAYSVSELKNICARIRGVPNFYTSRNKSQFFKRRNQDIYESEKKNIKNIIKLQSLANFSDSEQIEVVKCKSQPVLHNQVTNNVLDQLIKNKKQQKLQCDSNKITEKPDNNKKIHIPEETEQKKEERTDSDKITTTSSYDIRPIRDTKQSKKYNSTDFIADYLQFLEKGKVVKNIPNITDSKVKKLQRLDNKLNRDKKALDLFLNKVGNKIKKNKEKKLKKSKKLLMKDMINQKNTNISISEKENKQSQTNKINSETEPSIANSIEVEKVIPVSVSDDPMIPKRKEKINDDTPSLVKVINSNEPLAISETHSLPNLLVPTPDVQNHFRSVVFRNVTTSKHIFRMMLWEKLYESYHNKSLYIWYNNKITDGKLLATNNSKQPSQEHINVKLLKNVTTELPEIVKSLISDKLPGKAFDASNTYGIFVFNGQNWEIRGTMLKKPTGTSELVRSDPPARPISDPLGSEKNLLDEEEKEESICLQSKEIPLAVAEPQLVFDKVMPPSIRVPIPIGLKDSRWFMLILENDFAVLRLKTAAITIKYSALKHACQFAMRIKKTVRFLIRRTDLTEPDEEPAFGGYAVPGLLERVFFGPYNLVEDHGIVTYRYINGKLLDTRQANKIVGDNDSRRSKGIWLYTRGGAAAPFDDTSVEIENNRDVAFVDLTEDDDNIDNNNKQPSASVNTDWDTIDERGKHQMLLEKIRGPKDTIIPANSNSVEQTLAPANSLQEEKNPLAILQSKDIEMPRLEKIEDIVATNKPVVENRNQIMPKLKPMRSLLKSNLYKLKSQSKLKKNVSNKKRTHQVLTENLNSNEKLTSATKVNTTAAIVNTTATKVTLAAEDSKQNKISTTTNVTVPEKISSNNSLSTVNQTKSTSSNRRKRKLRETQREDDDLEIISSTISNKPANKIMWLISELYNLGYIEIKTYLNSKIQMLSPIGKRIVQFNEMNAAIEWIDKLLRTNMYFVPADFQIRMFLVEDKKSLAGRRPLEENELRGYHMICAKGLFDMTELNSLKIEDLGISHRERDKILAKQPELIEQKYIYQLGDFFLPVDTLRSMRKDTILNLIPSQIRRLQKSNIGLKKLKAELLAENKELNKKYNQLCKESNKNDTSISNNSKTLNNRNIREDAADDDDDDVVIIEDDPLEPSPPQIVTSSEPPVTTKSNDIPTVTTTNQQSTVTTINSETSSVESIVISNVTSLSEEYLKSQKQSQQIQPLPVATFEPINLSCLIVGGKKILNSTSQQPPIAKVASEDTNVVRKLTAKKSVFAPVILPDGKQLLIPINAANQGKKILVNKNNLSPIKHLVTFKSGIKTTQMIPTNNKNVKTVKNALQSLIVKANALQPPSSKQINTSTVVNKTNNASLNSDEIIEID